MNKEEIIKMIRDDNTPKELIIAQFETAFKYQMDLQKKNIDILHNNQNKLIDEIGEKDKEIERLNNIINELEKMIDNFDVFKEFTFPLMKRDEEQQVKSSIDYEWKKSIKEPFLNKVKELKGDK